MVRASHLMKNCKIAIIGIARVSLQLHSIAVPQCIMEKVHPSHFLSLSNVCVSILKLCSPSIFTSWVAWVSSSYFIALL